MEDILKVLSEDLIVVGYCLGILGVAWLSNMTLSLYFNVKIGFEDFDWNKFLKGVFKLLSLVVGTGLLVCAIDLGVNIIEYIGGMGSTEVGDTITVGSIVLTIGLSTYKYIKQAYETLVSILGK